MFIPLSLLSLFFALIAYEIFKIPSLSSPKLSNIDFFEIGAVMLLFSLSQIWNYKRHSKLQVDNNIKILANASTRNFRIKLVTKLIMWTCLVAIPFTS